MKRVAAFAAWVALVLATGADARGRGLPAADDVLQKSRAVYADLKSYADTGVVAVEYGTDSVDRNTFVTRFNRAPRHFLLDYHAQGGGRYVVWGDPDAFHTWWKVTGDVYDYPNPNNAPAVSTSGRNTGGTSGKIPTLLYSKGNLLSDFAYFSDAVNDGTEPINGRSCYRILGLARDVYAATGKEVNVRKMTLWIDTESMLIRKVLEEWKSTPGTRNRVVTSYEPQANPAFDEARFRFDPKEAGK